MKKGALLAQFLIAGLIMFAVPAGLMYYYDTLRIVELENVNRKILSAESQKDVSIIKDLVTARIQKLSADLSPLSPDEAQKRYARAINDNSVRNDSYSKTASVKKIQTAFLGAVKNNNAKASLLSMNGKTYVSTDAGLKNADFGSNPKFAQAKSSRKASFEINFNAGYADYFFPVLDVKDRLVSLIYAREDISAIADKIRQDKQSARGLNFIVDESGQVILNSDRQKENSESVIMMADIKPILTEAGPEILVAEKNYNNLRGQLGYKKIEPYGFILCVFTPNSDHKSLDKPVKKYTTIMTDARLGLPAYVFLAIALIAGILIMAAASNGPYAPLRKINSALTHIDEPGFEELLPKDKKGIYRKVIDAIIILKGRLKASEDNAHKLNGILKEREEELSKEASRADVEISELRSAIKVAESNKAALEDEVARAKRETEAAKKEAQQKVEMEKGLMQVKVTNMEKEIQKLKDEVKKAQESTVPAEKENMRMDSVLMMNTELKGVLSVIKTYISSVLGGEGKITDAQQQFLGVVINKSARLERLINDLTELAKIEKGEIALARQPADANNIIQDIVLAIQPQADIKKVELKVNFASSLSKCYGDVSKVSNIASQLLNQAIKVSPRGGKVAVDTKEDKESVLISITDFGMSMPQSKTAALFVNFHGPESKAGPEFANTGLRFPIIKAMMKNMGGDIWVESEIGKGKSFILALSKKADGKAAPPAPSQPAAAPFSAPVTSPTPPTAPAGLKIQRGMDSAAPSPGPSMKITPPAAPGANPATVSDLLNFDVPISQAPAIPGAKTAVPAGLLVKKEPPAPVAPLPDVKIEAPKKQEINPLPSELPPLPELEDDKGTDKI